MMFKPYQKVWVKNNQTGELRAAIYKHMWNGGKFPKLAWVIFMDGSGGDWASLSSLTSRNEHPVQWIYFDFETKPYGYYLPSVVDIINKRIAYHETNKV